MKQQMYEYSQNTIPCYIKASIVPINSSIIAADSFIVAMD